MRPWLGSVFAIAVGAVHAQAAPPSGPGAEIYSEHCASCHGVEGQPDLPEAPDFSLGQGLRKSDAELMEAIRFGVGSMPGFDGIIRNEDLIDVLFYIRVLER